MLNKGLAARKQGVILLTALMIACLVFPACAPVPTDKNPANDVLEGDLYRNTKYGFSIVFPAGWQQGGSNSASVVRRAMNSKGHSVVIGVTELPLFTRFFTRDVEGVVKEDEIVKSMGEQFEDFKLLDKGTAQVGGERAAWMKYSLSYMVRDKKSSMTLVVYNVLRSGILYTLTVSDVPEAKSSVESFKFENR